MITEDAPLIGIVDVLQTDVLFILEQTVELGVVAMEAKFGKDEADIGANQSAIAYGDYQ